MTGALIASVWVAGCSKPGPEPRSAANQGAVAPSRDLQLADSPDPQGAVVSDIEAGRTPPRAHSPEGTRRTKPEVAPRTEMTKTAVAALDQAPKLSATGASAEVPVTLAAAPAAPEMVETVHYTGGGGSIQTADDWSEPAPLNRVGGGPRVIIRGGRGGVDDDCDLHRPGIRRMGGVAGAVHNTVPQFGGYRGR